MMTSGVFKHGSFFLLAFALLLNGCAKGPRHASLTSTTPSYSVPAGGIYHTVERGQTLYRIAKTYHVDVSELMRVNHIYNPTQLEVGQKLFIPTKVVPPSVVSPRSYEPVSLEKA